MRQSHLKEEMWLVSSCMGTNESSQLAEGEGQKHGLLPCAGVAAKLLTRPPDDGPAIPEAILGEAFCFLPLSIATGLPVHINSSFAIMSNRRGIWERSSSTQQQDFEVRWNESLMQDAVCNAYIQLLESMKSLCENGAIEVNPFHALWPRCSLLKSSTWKTLVTQVYSKLIGNSLPLLRSDDTWLDIDNGYILADDLRDAPNVKEAMKYLSENVFEMTRDICDTLKDCNQEEALQRHTLDLKRFFVEFIFPNMDKLPDEIRNPLVCFGLDRILGSREELAELVSLFKAVPCIPCSEDGKRLARPCDLINPKGAAGGLFSPEDNRFPVGEDFLTEDRVHILETLGMKKDVLSWSEICERAKSVEDLAESCYEGALERSRKLVAYLGKHIENLPKEITPDETKAIRETRFLPFIREPPKELSGLPWKGQVRSKEQFCSPQELFVPRDKELVGSCCLILSTHEKLGCGKVEKKVKEVFGLFHRRPNYQQVLEQLDNMIEIWSQLNKEDQSKNKPAVMKICCCVYDYLNKYCSESNEDTEGHEKTLPMELARRKWLFINDAFVSCDQVACSWHGWGAPYLYGLPPEFNETYKSLLQTGGIKETFDAKDFLGAIHSLEESKQCSALTDEELKVAVTFLNEMKKNADKTFLEKNSDKFYLPDSSKVLTKANDLTINNTPWLMDREDSRYVHADITAELAFELGAKSLLDRRIGKYSRTLGTPFGQQEKLTDRLKTILQSYPCDSGILKELVQNADDAQATEIHFIYDTRTLRCNKVFQHNPTEIQGPALCVYNNQAFSEKDFKGIQKLGIGSKSDNGEKTGRFGVGFNAVYHLTDCPSFISNGDTLCILDPHCRYAPSATPEYPGERFDAIDQEFQADFPDVMKGYLSEFGFDLEGSTMFRLPLRTGGRSLFSEISNKSGALKITTLIQDFEAEAKRSMLFLNHIKKISISTIDRNNKLVKITR